MTACYGIDPSTLRVSIAYVTDDGQRGVETRSFRTDLRDGERLWHIYAETFGLCRQLHEIAPARLVLVEQPFGRNVPPVSYLAMGAIMMAATRVTDAPVQPIPPPTWKLRALGKGNASKDDVLAWARQQGYGGALFDEADAMGIAEAARKAAGA